MGTEVRREKALFCYLLSAVNQVCSIYCRLIRSHESHEDIGGDGDGVVDDSGVWSGH